MKPSKKTKAPIPVLSKKDLEQAIQTNFPSPIAKSNALSDEKKMEVIEHHFKKIMETLGLNLEDHSLAKTPARIAKMYVNEIFSGLDAKNFPPITFVEDPTHQEFKSRIVFVKVSFTSFCEHHFVPMTGTAYVAYKPHDRLIGLSKIPRLVRYFSKRPQLQERLTAQIADSLVTLLNSEDVAVSISAQHYCVVARGIEDRCSNTITNVLRGDFDDNEALRREFFEAINRKET